MPFDYGHLLPSGGSPNSYFDMAFRLDISRNAMFCISSSTKFSPILFRNQNLPSENSELPEKSPRSPFWRVQHGVSACSRTETAIIDSLSTLWQISETRRSSLLEKPRLALVLTQRPGPAGRDEEPKGRSERYAAAHRCCKLSSSSRTGASQT